MSDSSEEPPVRSLPDLISRLRRVDAFAAVIRALERGDSGTIDGAWGSSSALATAAIADALHAGVARPGKGVANVAEFSQ